MGGLHAVASLLVLTFRSSTFFALFTLLFSFPATQSGWVPLGWTNENSGRDEARFDAVLQQAATAALARREGTIIIMDARTGRVRALINPDGAYRQALMPGSVMKPFTALKTTEFTCGGAPGRETPRSVNVNSNRPVTASRTRARSSTRATM